MQHAITEGIRPPGVAGLFYPSSPQQLSGVVGEFLDAAGRGSGERPRAIVAPHAGYDYSGEVAGRAFAAAARLDWDVIVLIGPSHLEHFQGVSLFPGLGYRTPLGDCLLDADLAGAVLEAAPRTIRSVLNGHWIEGDPRQEHALEVELPFLQSLLPAGPSIVPLVMGEQTWPTVEELGGALAVAIKASPDPDRVLIVASSDLSHFHGDSVAESVDRATLEAVGAFDPAAFHQALRSGEAEACGGGAIAATLIASGLLGATTAETIAYRHSGHVTGEGASVVGYGAVRIY